MQTMVMERMEYYTRQRIFVGGSWGLVLWVLLIGLLLPGWVEADGNPFVPPDLTTLSLEELMGMEVTLASRKVETLFETAAAVL